MNTEDTVVKVFRAVAEKLPKEDALMSKDGSGVFQTLSFEEFFRLAGRFGAGLMASGVQRGDHVGIISDNRKEWILANIGILGIGAVDVPRGSDTMPDEARYILQHSDCAVSLVENEEQLRKILSRKADLPLLKTLIVIDEAFDKASFSQGGSLGVEILTFAEIMARGEAVLSHNPEAFRKEVDRGTSTDLATLIYTSGTTGEPKGVMLTHANFLHNLRTIPKAVHIGPEDIFLSVLPVWHSFERTVEYFVLSRGTALAYSKPIGKIMLADMEKVRPTAMASVPRIWDGVRSAVIRNATEHGGIKAALFRFFVSVGQSRALLKSLVTGLYPQFRRRIRALDFLIAILPFLLLTPIHALGNLLVFGKVKAKLGGRFRFTVSGGGALPPHVDKFFQAVGVLLLEGYGLTETAPVVSVRLLAKPVFGTIGPLLAEMEMKVLDENGRPVPPGRKGVIHLKGPNVMKGYYKRPDKTAEVLSADGWLNTGDLGMVTYRGELKIIGRVKETIVLLGGENVEPVPIEDAILESDFIDQTIVLGQDQKFLAALVVPNQEALEKYASHQEISYVTREDLIENPQIIEHILDEINSRVCAARGFREFERVFRFKMITKHFEVGRELSAKQSIKRDVINQIYKKEIAALFAR